MATSQSEKRTTTKIQEALKANREAPRPAHTVVDAGPTKPADKPAPTAGRADPFQTLDRVLDDPESAALFASSLSTKLERSYGPLLDKLNLTPEQKQRLLKLLVDREIATADALRLLHAQTGVTKEEAVATIKSVRGESDTQIAALLGDHYNDLKAFDQSIPYRLQADKIASNLALSQEPLSSQQREKLVQGLSTNSALTATKFMKNGVLDVEAYTAAKLENDNALLASVHDTLSERQYQALDRYLQDQRTKIQLAARMMKKK